MQSHEEARRRSLCREVLTYWLDRPEAKDTLEGIRDWWLRDASDTSGGVLQDVLEMLVRRGWVTVRGTERWVYGLESGSIEAVKTFLREDPEMRSGE